MSDVGPSAAAPVYCHWVSTALERLLGLRLEHVDPADSDAIADELAARLARA